MAGKIGALPFTTDDVGVPGVNMLVFTHILAAATCRQRKPKPDLSQLTGHYRSASGDDAKTEHSVHFAGGKINVDGLAIARPRFRSGVVSWSEKTSAYAASGCLHVMAGGTMLSGVIAHGHDETSARAEFVQLGLADLTFTTEVMRTDRPAQVHAWEAGPPLVVGIRFEDGVPTVIAQIDGVDVQIAPLPPPDGSNYARLDVAIVTGQDWPTGPLSGKPYALPLKSDVLIATDGSSFAGAMTTTTETPPFPWRGVAARIPHIMEAQSPQGVAPLDLSLVDLMSLTTAGASDIARAYFNNFTVLGMQSAWRDGLFGLTPPAVPADVRAVYDAHSTLFTEHASDAIILHQLASLPSDRVGHPIPSPIPTS